MFYFCSVSCLIVAFREDAESGHGGGRGKPMPFPPCRLYCRCRICTEREDIRICKQGKESPLKPPSGNARRKFRSSL
jgi:hypothetical protein